MRLTFLGIFLSIVCCNSAIAAETINSCSTLNDNIKRLACYDSLSKTAPAPPSDSQPVTSPEPPPATTKDIIESHSPSDFKNADVMDLQVAPRKFLSKPIEVRGVHCYYADVDDYRCLVTGYGTVAIFSQSIEPAEEKTRLENDCGTMKAAIAPKCTRTLHFVLDAFDNDQVDNNVNRVILRPKTIIVVAATSPKKKR